MHGDVWAGTWAGTWAGMCAVWGMQYLDQSMFHSFGEKKKVYIDGTCNLIGQL